MLRAIMSACLAVFTCCAALAQTAENSPAFDVASVKPAAPIVGNRIMVGNVGGAMAPIAIGYMLAWSHSNWNLTFYVSAAVYAMGIPFWAFLDPVTPIERS